MIKRFLFQAVYKVIALVLFQSVIIHASSEQNNQLVKLAENKRIEASICADSMNRIFVANDRITQIFGDEGTFESQNDETTGQIFLKPTMENGSKNLSLTLITEQGITQDLTLIPTSKSPQTLILTRGPNNPNSKNDKAEYRDTFKAIEHTSESHLGYASALPIQGQLLELLKKAIHNQLPTYEEESPTRHPPQIEGISLTPSQSWKAGPYVVDALIVDNTSETSLELQEKDFYQAGDLALSFYASESGKLSPHQRVVKPDAQATLYVVRYGKTN
jgi:hypothetical protein